MITGFVPPQSATSQQDLQISALTMQESLNPGSVTDSVIQGAVDASISGAQGFVISGNLKAGSVAPGDLVAAAPLSAKNSFVDEAKKASGNVAVIQATSDKEKKEKEFKAMLLFGVVIYFGYKYFMKGMK